MKAPPRGEVWLVDLKPGAFDAQGLVTVPVAWLVRKVGSLNAAQMRQVEGGVCNWLGFGQNN